MPLQGRNNLTLVETYNSRQMWLSVLCSKCPSRENLAPLCTLNSRQMWLSEPYSKCPTPYSSMFCSGCPKCGYLEYSIRSRTCSYRELSKVRPSYLKCPTLNISTIQSPALDKILLCVCGGVKHLDQYSKVLYILF